MSASPRVFLVVDPVQDWEESLTILGVFGSLAAAQMAGKAIRHQSGPARHYWFERDERVIEIQEWTGREHVRSWTYSPEAPRWVPTEEQR